MTVAIIVSIAIVAAVMFILFRRRNRVEGPFSIVFMRRSPPQLSKERVAATYMRVFEKAADIQVIPLPEGNDVAYVAIAQDAPTIAVIQANRPYFESNALADIVPSLESSTLRNALSEHTHWLSVDAMGLPHAPRNRVADIHRLLARFAADFYDDQCVILFLRALDRYAEPGDYVETKLRQGRIEELFGDDDLHAPMFHVDGDDPQLATARAQAKSRLPEFIHACKSNPDTCNGMFKVGFPTESGEDEFIWLSFAGFEGQEISGHIANEPIDPRVPRKGEKVTVPTDRIVDWAYTDNDELPHGLFIDRVLMARVH